MRGSAPVNLVNMLCAKHAYLRMFAALNITCEQHMLPAIQWQALYQNC